jgi:hypothetical protein
MLGTAMETAKMKHQSPNLDFAQIGTIFNQVTTSLVGGVTAQNARLVMRDLQTIQSSLETLIAKHPEQFQGEAGIHAQNIVDQVNLEMQAIKSIGTDPYAAKYINDVQRDLIDIVQGDDQLAGLASRHGASGFAPVPDLLVPPAPFQGNAEQTAFMKQFAADAVDLGNRAVALADQGAPPNGADTQKLIQDITDYVNNANAFTVAQGGLYSARFNNEFALDGVNGTASRALIHALQAGDADQVQAAANVLAANAADVAGNMLGIGDTPMPTGNGIPDHIDTFAQAGSVFNDATTKLIGGVYDGAQNDGNRQSIINDLTAARDGIAGLLQANPEQFEGAAGNHAQKIVALLGKEIDAVEAAGTGPGGSVQINALHRTIVGIVQNDPTLKAAATDGDIAGFAPLPQGPGGALMSKPHAPAFPVAQHDGHFGVGSGHGADHGGHGFSFEHFWG